MPTHEPPPLRATAQCACGRVELEATGAPVTCAACYCDDCQEAGRRIEALPKAVPACDPDGGTPYVLYRKDRVRFSKGADLLEPHKLVATSTTKRVVATCCNSPMLLAFDDRKHWVDVYRARVLGDPPPLQMRICTKFKPAGAVLPTDVPGYPGYPPRFIAKLLAAWIAMLFRR